MAGLNGGLHRLFMRKHCSGELKSGLKKFVTFNDFRTVSTYGCLVFSVKYQIFFKRRFSDANDEWTNERSKKMPASTVYPHTGGYTKNSHRRVIDLGLKLKHVQK